MCVTGHASLLEAIIDFFLALKICARTSGTDDSVSCAARKGMPRVSYRLAKGLRTHGLSLLRGYQSTRQRRGKDRKREAVYCVFIVYYNDGFRLHMACVSPLHVEVEACNAQLLPS